MYEMRMNKRKEMLEKKWFNYALLLAAIFIYSQATSSIKTNTGYSIAAIILTFIMHLRSVGNITEKLLKIKPNNIANIAMIVTLSAISAFCYFIRVNLVIIILLNILAIGVYVIVAFICSRLKTGDN